MGLPRSLFECYDKQPRRDEQFNIEMALRAVDIPYSSSPTRPLLGPAWWREGGPLWKPCRLYGSPNAVNFGM